ALVWGLIVRSRRTARRGQAGWLDKEEREALESELEREKAGHPPHSRHMSWAQALKQPKVLLLAAAYFFIVTGNYGVESFLPTILKDWYHLDLNKLTWLAMLPASVAVVGQLAAGWSLGRHPESRLHALILIHPGAITSMV